jgi:uncharacterized protein (DUF1800 family)
MKHPITSSLLLTAVLALPVLSARAMEFEEARHLLNRTGFGASYEQILEYLPFSYEEGVDRILARVSGKAVTPPLPWVRNSLPVPSGNQKPQSSDDKRKRQKERQRILRERGVELKSWWYREMIDTPSPVQERMTLFWHNHFTSSLRKVRYPVLIYRQNELLRENAIGNFGVLLHTVARDPAMVLYLDNQTNLKKSPNENFARELLELFTLGEGNYTEQDIKEAARAFTGWGINRKTGGFAVRSGQHDDGSKRFMGQMGMFGGDEIIEILLKDPGTSEHITEKLWLEFISPIPDENEVQRLARIFRDHDYDLKPLLRAMWMSPAFRDPRHRGTLVRSPVDLSVGTIRTLKVPVNEPRVLVYYGRALGQDIFDPPNVKGWPGGERWIDTNTIVMRRVVLEDILHGTMLQEEVASMEDLNRKMRGAMMSKTSAGGSEPADRASASFGKNPDALGVQAVLLPFPPVEAVPGNPDTMALVRHLLFDPVYQLR